MSRCKHGLEMEYCTICNPEAFAGDDDCICGRSDETILRWIRNQNLPDHALLNRCCWRRICQVRGRYFRLVEHDTWVEICTKRGYLFERENSRGS